MINENISDEIKQFSYDICNKHGITIKEMENDKDHIHYMIETNPNIWKEHTFLTNGYFVCSVENVSEKHFQIYIENQG